MSKLRLAKLNASELRQLLAEVKSEADQCQAAIAALVSGAQSASISTAGGSRSFTRVDLDKLRAYAATVNRRYRSLLASAGLIRRRGTRRIWADWSAAR